MMLKFNKFFLMQFPVLLRIAAGITRMLPYPFRMLPNCIRNVADCSSNTEYLIRMLARQSYKPAEINSKCDE